MTAVALSRRTLFCTDYQGRVVSLEFKGKTYGHERKDRGEGRMGVRIAPKGNLGCAPPQAKNGKGNLHSDILLQYIAYKQSSKRP